jgi:regulator of protease activity HflC (stomatin/prohibitin superfamily)
MKRKFKMNSSYEPSRNAIELSRATMNNDSPTRVHDWESIYLALERMNLLVQPNSDVLGHLVRMGELGMCSDNGVPKFLAPGRHILWSPYNAYKGNVPISQKFIQLGENLQIVTIDNSEIGLSTSMGKNILLEPGQHILTAPQRYIKSERVDKNYVHLGTHHWISVPVGNVAVAFNQGKKIIITPDPLKVAPEHEQYIHCTKGQMFKIDSPTFMFNEATGFKSTQMEEIQLAELKVNTSEMISLNVAGSIRYQIVDPVRAFLMTEDVVDDIRIQARATLTSVFAKLSIDEIASSIASTNLTSKKDHSNIPQDMLHHATNIFMEEFQHVVSNWGVDARLINITNMQLENATFREAVQARAQQNLQANTRLSVVATQTETELQEADRNRRKQIIEAEAKAESIRRLADAEVYSAKKKSEAAKELSNEPLARELALMDAQAKIAGNLGDKTVITDMNLGGYGVRGTLGQTMWLKQDKARPLSLIQEDPQPMMAKSAAI